LLFRGSGGVPTLLILVEGGDSVTTSKANLMLVMVFQDDAVENILLTPRTFYSVNVLSLPDASRDNGGGGS
jgi:hypothetical protein